MKHFGRNSKFKYTGIQTVNIWGQCEVVKHLNQYHRVALQELYLEPY